MFVSVRHFINGLLHIWIICVILNWALRVKSFWNIIFVCFTDIAWAQKFTKFLLLLLIFLLYIIKLISDEVQPQTSSVSANDGGNNLQPLRCLYYNKNYCDKRETCSYAPQVESYSRRKSSVLGWLHVLGKSLKNVYNTMSELPEPRAWDISTYT